MTTEPQRHDADDPDHDQAVSAWLASEAFTDFMTLAFAAGVKQAAVEQAARGRERPGVTQPVFMVVCGINGAGKSTLADALAATPELAGFTFLNPDRLSVGYRQADPALTRDLADMRALRHVAGEIHRLMAGRQSFASETVGANASYRRYVEAARAAGYLVRVMFVGLRTAEQSTARVALRVRLGGHSIPTADILRRWPAVHANLAWFAAHADMLDVYANAEDGAAPKVIARVRAGRVEALDRTELPVVAQALGGLPSSERRPVPQVPG